MSIVTFGSTGERRKDSDVVEIGVQTRAGLSQKLMLFTVPLICEPLSGMPEQFCPENYNYLSCLDLADPPGGKGQITPDVLVGLDHYWDLLTGEVIRGEDGPVAVNTTLGWVLSGPISMWDNRLQSANLVSHVLRVDTHGIRNDTKRLEDQLRAFWDLESLGISDTESSVYEQFEGSITFSDGRYEVPLPWKDPLAVLPDNYRLSLRACGRGSGRVQRY